MNALQIVGGLLIVGACGCFALASSSWSSGMKDESEAEEMDVMFERARRETRDKATDQQGRAKQLGLGGGLAFVAGAVVLGVGIKKDKAA